MPPSLSPLPFLLPPSLPTLSPLCSWISSTCLYHESSQVALWLCVFPTQLFSFSRTEKPAYLFLKPSQWMALYLTCRKCPINVWWMKVWPVSVRKDWQNWQVKAENWVKESRGNPQPYFLTFWFAGCSNSSWHSGPFVFLPDYPSIYNFLPQSHTHAGSLKFCRDTCYMIPDRHAFSGAITFTLPAVYSSSRSLHWTPTHLSKPFSNIILWGCLTPGQA